MSEKELVSERIREREREIERVSERERIDERGGKFVRERKN